MFVQKAWSRKVLAIAAAVSIIVAACSDEESQAPTDTPANQPPQVLLVTAARPMIMGNDTTQVICSASDPDSDSVSYMWTAQYGYLSGGVSANPTIFRSNATTQSPFDTLASELTVLVSDGSADAVAHCFVAIVNGDLWNDTGEPFVDQPDSSGHYNGVFDALEPWYDRPNEFGVNNIGVWDPWDPYSDLNANGYWDSGERWFDLPSGVRPDGVPRGLPALNGQFDGPNSLFDEFELFTAPSAAFPDPNPSLPIVYTWNDLLSVETATFEWLTTDPSSETPAYLTFQSGFSTWSDRDGDASFDIPHSMNDSHQDLWYDTGEPFLDTPDSLGRYNRRRDPGEVFLDLPSGYFSPFYPRSVPTRNAIYDGPNGAFDEYELFTIINSGDPRVPVRYMWADPPDEFPFGEADWMNLPPLPGGHPGYLARIAGRSTWLDGNANGVFDIP